MEAVKRIIVIMVIALCLPFQGYCITLKAAGDDTGAPCQTEMHSLLNAYSAFADEYYASIVRELRLLASTSEVKTGEWTAMTGLLEMLDKEGIGAAAVWYALPDGGYYTAEKGLTGENLADRPYFPALIAGSEVKGELVISRSTGKRSAVFAVPVIKNNKTVGALGVSLSVDEVSRVVNEKMLLPSNFVFYALDSSGRTSMHEKPELLFEYPSDMGSDTLNEAVRKMLSESGGVVEYEFQGNWKTVYFKRSPLTGWVYALGLLSGSAPAGK